MGGKTLHSLSKCYLGVLLLLVLPATALLTKAQAQQIQAGESHLQDDPDKEFEQRSFLPKQLKGLSDVWLADFRVTSWARNHGPVAYMARSVGANDRFFNLAQVFLERLKELDRAAERTSETKWAEIDERAPDVFKLALEVSKNNPYWALKLMALYGHDDVLNKLSAKKVGSAARSKALDGIKPSRNSVLYLNGAIGELQYPASLISKAKEIAQACNDPEFTYREADLCNDRDEHFHACYYHVIVAAFSGCRVAIGENIENSTISKFNRERVDGFYLAANRSGKIDRFLSEVREAERSTACESINPIAPQTIEGRVSTCLPRSFFELLESALGRLDVGKQPYLPPASEVVPKIGQRGYRAAQAIVNRYEFELNLRMWQHTEGLKFGRKACTGISTLEYAPGPLTNAGLSCH